MNKISILINELIEEKFLITFKPTREFYKKVGIGQKRFQMLRENKTSPTFEEMQKLSEYFNIPYTQLVEESK